MGNYSLRSLPHVPYVFSHVFHLFLYALHGRRITCLHLPADYMTVSLGAFCYLDHHILIDPATVWTSLPRIQPAFPPPTLGKSNSDGAECGDFHAMLGHIECSAIPALTAVPGTLQGCFSSSSKTPYTSTSTLGPAASLTPMWSQTQTPQITLESLSTLLRLGLWEDRCHALLRALPAS